MRLSFRVSGMFFARALMWSAAALAASSRAAAVGAVDTAGPSREALFARYAVAKVYRGPVRLPDFRNRDRAFSSFRTRIREGMRSGANFAGHYAIVNWGCGTECAAYVIADVVTGKVFDFPFRADDHRELDLDTKPKSRLIIAGWISYPDSSSRDDVQMIHCVRQNLLWNGSSMVPLSKPTVIATVKETDVGQCGSP